MSRAAGFVLAAGLLSAANEVIFAPLVVSSSQSGSIQSREATFGNTAINNFNWRIVPATAILALLLGGLETVTPDFAVGLGGLVLLSVLIVPVGNAPTPIDNIAKVVTKKG